MMTFEEFFAKKKIDLVLLQRDNGLLYTEFKQHYVEMGPKSFDHTKKFWFNKLRKQYALVEESSEVTSSSAATKKTIVPVAAIQAASSSKPSGFKPRFKAGAAKPAASADSAAADVPAANGGEVSASSSKPSGFKPRFKAGVTKAQPPRSEEE